MATENMKLRVKTGEKDGKNSLMTAVKPCSQHTTAARIDLAGCSIMNAAGRMPGQCATADHTLIRAFKAHSGIRRGTLVWDTGMKLVCFAL